MDNVTHALAGLLLGEATVALAHRKAPVTPGFRRAALVLGVACAELPDADLLYAGPVLGMGKLGYMLHHRGHTHTVVFALVGALVAWGVTLAVARGVREHGGRRERAWLLALACACTLVAHIALDGTNSYGVHPWWPVYDAWQYGDSVFIIEPWLWVASIPPLLVLERSRVVRVLLVLAMVAILALGWRTGMVGHALLAALAVATLVMGALALAVRARHPEGYPPRHHARLALLGVVAWVSVEATFMATAHRSRVALGELSPPSMFVDAAITPQVANPLCHDVLLVERAGPMYQVTRGTVAPLPSLRTAASCSHAAALPGSVVSPVVQWTEQWRAPLADLRALAREHCEVAAALRFIRVPAWQRTSDGGARLWDMRYNRGGGGFAEVVVPPGDVACPAHVPPWTPPREGLLFK